MTICVLRAAREGRPLAEAFTPLSSAEKPKRHVHTTGTGGHSAGFSRGSKEEKLHKELVRKKKMGSIR